MQDKEMDIVCVSICETYIVHHLVGTIVWA